MSAAPWSGEHADRLGAAKLWAVTPGAGDLPYLATALYSLITVPTERVGTVACDVRWRLYVNPSWLAAADVPEVGRAVVHQTWHLLADHAARAGSMDVRRATAQAWRTATDLTIGQVVPWTDDTLPDAARCRVPRDRSAEEYYATISGLPVPPAPLVDDDEPAGNDQPGSEPSSAAGADGADYSCGSACDGIARSHDVPGDGEILGVDGQVAEAIRKQIAIAFAAHCRARGSVPGRWDRWVAGILDPVVPWQQVLHAAVRRGLGWAHGQSDTTYTRISRRQAALPGVVLPALRRPVPAVAIVLDTSGSVDDGLLAQALGEVDGVLRSLAVPDGSVTTFAVDAAVQAAARVRDARSAPLSGGGGTDMGAGIAAARDSRPAPHLIIVLTDGYTPWPDTPPGRPVVVGVLGRDRDRLPPTPHWAQRVEVVDPA
jgi:predicted metal-dependent peptidase